MPLQKQLRGERFTLAQISSLSSIRAEESQYLECDGVKPIISIHKSREQYFHTYMFSINFLLSYTVQDPFLQGGVTYSRCVFPCQLTQLGKITGILRGQDNLGILQRDSLPGGFHTVSKSIIKANITVLVPFLLL